MLRKYMVSRALSLLVWTVVVVSCKGRATEPLDVPPSPQAKAEPAPLANVSTLPAPSSSLGSVRAGKPPESLEMTTPSRAWMLRATWAETPPGKMHRATRRDRADTFCRQRFVRERGLRRQGFGGQSPAIELTKRKLEPRLAITISQARARIVMSGSVCHAHGYGTRSRSDRYGHIVPVARRRMVLASLRPAHCERFSASAGSMSLRCRPRRFASAGVIIIDSISDRRLNSDSRGMGDSSSACCVTPVTGAPSCAGCFWSYERSSVDGRLWADEVPLHAELHWTTQGGMSFDVVSIARRVDLTPQDLAVPPALAVFESSELPASRGESLASKSDLAAFRSGPVDVQIGQSRGVETSSNESGLTVVNSSDELRIAWLEAVPVAWVAPGSKLSLQSLQRGRYMFQWRTFFGDAWEPLHR